MNDNVDLESAQRMTRDIADAAHVLSKGEARFLVDAYYAMQENRIRSNHQARQLGQTGEPNAVLVWLAKQDQTLEDQVKRALGRFADASELGRWCQSILGIGPVITAGLLAHIDINKAPTVGHIWAFAGLDPTKTWEKGQKRPWNAALKTLCWKIGESFVKVSGNEESFYGKVYRERKALELERNEAGEFKGQAAKVLTSKSYRRDTTAKACYEAGKLPPAHLHARAKRYAVKLFLAHFHEQAYRLELGKEPPVPYPIAFQGHAHVIPVPAR